MGDIIDKILKKHSLVNMSRKNIFLFSILVLGCALRLYNLGAHNLWFDEAYALNMSATVFVDPYWFISYPQPPLYYIFLHFWTNLLGQSEFVLRFPSLIFGTGSIFLVYLLAKLIFEQKAGLISALILSLSPLNIWYSQEARPYALSVMLIILFAYVCFLISKKAKLSLWVIFVIVAILSLYTNYFSLFIIIISGIMFFLVSGRNLAKSWLISCIFIFSVFFAWLNSFLRTLEIIQGKFWIPKISLKSILITFENFNVGYNGGEWVYILSFLLYSVFFILGISLGKEKKREITALLLFFLVPIAVTFVISHWIPVYLDRQLMLYSPFYYMIIAAGIVKIKRPFLKAGSLAAIFIFSFASLFNYFSYCLPRPDSYHVGGYAKRPVKPAADFINKNINPGDAVVFSHINIFSLWYYISNKTIPFFALTSKEDYFYRELSGRMRLGLDKYSWLHIVILEGVSSVPKLEPILESGGAKRVWLVTSAWQRYGFIEPQSFKAVSWFDKRYALLENKEIDGIYIRLYSLK